MLGHADGNGDWVLTIFTALSLVSYVGLLLFQTLCMPFGFISNMLQCILAFNICCCHIIYIFCVSAYKSFVTLMTVHGL